MNEPDCDYEDEESPFFTDPTQIFSVDPNYNNAVHKARFLQVPAEAAIQDAIQHAKLFPSTKESLCLLANVMLDPSNTLAIRDPNDLQDIELTNEILITTDCGTFYPYDKRGNILYDVINSLKYLNRNINSRSLGGMERKLQNQSEQVITQRNFMTTDDPARITSEPKKRKSIFQRRN